MAQRSKSKTPKPFGSGEYDYDDSILKIYGIDVESGKTDKEEEADFKKLMKSVANNPKRKSK